MEPEVNIQSLLDKIKTEGVEKANRQADTIIEQARKTASSILHEAKEERETMLAQARAEIKKSQEGFETAMVQAARNLILGLKDDIMGICMHVVERHVAESLTPQLMKDLILKIVDRWQTDGGNRSLEVLLSEKDWEDLEGVVWKDVQGEMKKGLVLKPVKKIQAGFRIGEKDGIMHYDFTQESIAEVLGAFLNPRIARYLKEGSDRQKDRA